MANFGKVNFAVALEPTSAFPLDARCYFTDLASAQAAAATAEEVGSTNTVYHFGMKLLVDDGTTATWYTIMRDGTLSDLKGELGTLDADNIRYKGGRLPDFLPEMITQDDYDALEESGKVVLTKPYFIPKGLV